MENKAIDESSCDIFEIMLDWGVIIRMANISLTNFAFPNCQKFYSRLSHKFAEIWQRPGSQKLCL